MAKETSADKPSKLPNLLGSGETLLTIEELVANDINAKVEQHVLCSKCRDVVSQSYILKGRERRVKATLDPWGCEEWLEQFVHYPSKEELQTSAVWGKCHLCTLLWDLVESDMKKTEESEESEEESEPMTYGPTFLQNCGPQIKQEKRKARAREHQKRAKLAARGSPPSPGVIFQIHCSDPNSICINVEVNGHIGFRVETNGRRCLWVKPIGPKDKEKEWEANRDDPIDNHHDAQVSISTASNGSFRLAKQWMDQCLKEHSICRETSMSSSRLPTRLLDVGASALDISLRLCITNTIHERPVLYLALSHRWGGAEILRLLEMNVEAFLQNIPEDELPLTFRDAIKITRRLGYRYLWIDSLCIIQDSAKDWELESAFMGDIYRGSVCTISALGAEDSHGGCFTTRNPLQYRPCLLTGDANEGMVARGSGLSNTLRDGPLLKRAWVVQEQMLSPRTLHYGSTAIFWECIECDATESFSEGDTWDWNTDKRYRRPKEAFKSMVLPGGAELGDMILSEGFKRFHHAWHEILRRYSLCSLTRREDKLVAINGVIRQIEQYTGLTSMAGLWKQYLLPELLWHTNNPEKFRPDFFQPKLYRAPTWSWASVDTIVSNSCPDLVRGRYENILGLSMWISYNLEWKAEIIEAKVAAKPNGQVTNGYLRIRGPMRIIEWTENSGLKGFQHNPQARSVSDTWLPDFRAGTSWEIWGLLIASRGTGSSNVRDARIDVGLVLEPVKGHDNVFRRFGYFHQCYWDIDTYPIFAGDKEKETRSIIII